MKKVGVHELGRLRDPKRTVIDVRSFDEFRAGHIPGARSIPGDDLGNLARSWDPREEILLYCNSGVRAKRALQTLDELGFSNVALVEGGFPAWQAAGLPVERQAKSGVSIQRQVFMTVGALVFASIMLDWAGVRGLRFLAAFMGLGLLYAGITSNCYLALFLERMPWNRRAHSNSDAGDQRVDRAAL